MKLTPWFDGNVKPVRAGVYQRKMPAGTMGFSLWNGRRWNFTTDTAEEAAEEVARSLHAAIPWRGLAQQPKGNK